MFLVVPLWNEDQERFPIFTIGLVLLNIAVFLIAWPMEQGSRWKVERSDLVQSAGRLTDIALKAAQGVSPEEIALLTKERNEPTFPSAETIALLKDIHRRKSLLPKDAYEWDFTYPHFEALAAAVQNGATGVTPYRRFGFESSRPFLPGILTHQFLHGGWMHLIGNMLFLWVFGCVVEQVLGGAVVLVYLLGGIAAALTQTFVVPSTGIMVGASGSISTLMGLGLALTPKAKVRLFYLLFAFISARYGFFASPLWFYVPLWFFEQAGMTLLTLKSDYNTVAYAAHAGGFITGLLGGWGLKAANNP